MEYLNGGELFDKITSNKRDLTEQFIQKIMKELLSALAYMHSFKIGKLFRFLLIFVFKDKYRTSLVVFYIDIIS